MQIFLIYKQVQFLCRFDGNIYKVLIWSLSRSFKDKSAFTEKPSIAFTVFPSKEQNTISQPEKLQK